MPGPETWAQWSWEAKLSQVGSSGLGGCAPPFPRGSEQGCFPPSDREHLKRCCGPPSA